MQLPEITIANQSFRNGGFLNASQVEVFLEVFSIGEWSIECLVQYTRTRDSYGVGRGKWIFGIASKKSRVRLSLVLRAYPRATTSNRKPPLKRSGSRWTITMSRRPPGSEFVSARISRLAVIQSRKPRG